MSSCIEQMSGAAHTLPGVTLVQKGGRPRVAIALGLVGGLIALVSGIRLLERPSTIAALLLIVAGCLMIVGGALIWADLLRKRRPGQRGSGGPFEG